MSVIVPTKNSGRTLRRCLESIRDQNHQAVEIVVVDNFSTDDTERIGAALADTFVRIGPERCAQRNAGLALSRGSYVLFIDSDMYLSPETIDSCIVALADGVAGVIVREASFGEGFWSRCKAFERTFYLDDRAVSAARFFRKDLVVNIGGYDETMIAGEDWDLSMRVEEHGDLRFAATTISHDEGRIVLRKQLAKKYYYGTTLGRFVAKHGRAGRQKLSPARSSLLKSVSRLVDSPRLVMGMYLLKVVDLVGIVSGLCAAAFASMLSKRMP
ncbi:MAG: glycosyltransferase family A protein [Vulcanimicrobiaceae bacterium]